jgi:hypothetical protein
MLFLIERTSKQRHLGAFFISSSFSRRCNSLLFNHLHTLKTNEFTTCAESITSTLFAKHRGYTPKLPISAPPRWHPDGARSRKLTPQEPNPARSPHFRRFLRAGRRPSLVLRASPARMMRHSPEAVRCIRLKPFYSSTSIRSSPFAAKP